MIPSLDIWILMNWVIFTIFYTAVLILISQEIRPDQLWETTYEPSPPSMDLMPKDIKRVVNHLIKLNEDGWLYISEQNQVKGRVEFLIFLEENRVQKQHSPYAIQHYSSLAWYGHPPINLPFEMQVINVE